jgi:beta-glucosidase
MNTARPLPLRSRGWLAPALLTATLLPACGSDDPPATEPAPDASPPGPDVPGDGDTAAPPVDEGTLAFGLLGSLSLPDGRGGFRFGAATAAAQIEDGLIHNDWYWWTLPTDQGGLGNGEFVGEAVRGFTLAVQDVGLMQEMNLDAYRFSIDWSRIEPRRDEIDREAVAHYRRFLQALVDAGIRPMVTIHHFSSPAWVDDPRRPACAPGDAPTDDHLCGWGHPVGGPLIVEELIEHTRLLAAEYGDLVDEWCTLNEPVNYLIASYGVEVFPPGRNLILTSFDTLIDVVRNYLAAHAGMFAALREADVVDADGDGEATSIGLTLSVVDWAAARGNAPSDLPEDLAARDAVEYVYHYLVADALTQGVFDADLDGTPDEQHPTWAGTLDWLGVQYYFRAGVTAEVPLIPRVNAIICFGGFDFGSCLPPEDPTKFVPSMGYEFWEPGMGRILRDMGARYPAMPLVVTEAGIAAENGTRRAENTVRMLEQIHGAMTDGVDVRGYYHWSLIDNFEWAEGFEPRFGLYRVDRTTWARTATEGATALGTIAEARRITAAQRALWGGLGPMSPEVDHGGE